MSARHEHAIHPTRKRRLPHAHSLGHCSAQPSVERTNGGISRIPPYSSITFSTAWTLDLAADIQPAHGQGRTGGAGRVPAVPDSAAGCPSINARPSDRGTVVQPPPTT